MDVPKTRYAKSGDLHIAYQVVGEGPLDLVFVPGFVSHLEFEWEGPLSARFFQRLASFSRLIRFDKRGTGLSDRPPGVPTLEQRMDDVRAVMDAAGSQKAALFGASEGGPMSLLFSATYPERTSALVLYGSYARRAWASDHPFGITEADMERALEDLERNWGGSAGIETRAPSMAHDEHFGRWRANWMRLAASPGAAVAILRMNMEIDVRHILPVIRVPTLVAHRTGDRLTRVEQARYMAERIPGAKLVELPGIDHTPWVGDSDPLLDEVEEFLTGVRHVAEPDRVLATVLFTDIVGSTEQAARLGDRRWRELIESHHALVRKELARFRGREIDTAGDGFLATFDGPARAVRCASAIRDAVKDLGIEIRAGLHTGECEVMGDKLGGIAVHIGARIASLAKSGEVLVSSTVKDLVAGSGLEFEERGTHALKGIPGEWRLFAVRRT
ncbi:MAG: adenylate/guanylate cyclase domain-containing protein [Candidatus Rokubacteria bacterium]|nr:adenylate/guanylate cyclase domain-containing protein [Candidatus Rokubacteria bacterium]